MVAPVRADTLITASPGRKQTSISITSLFPGRLALRNSDATQKSSVITSLRACFFDKKCSAERVWVLDGTKKQSRCC